MEISAVEISASKEELFSVESVRFKSVFVWFIDKKGRQHL